MNVFLQYCSLFGDLHIVGILFCFFKVFVQKCDVASWHHHNYFVLYKLLELGFRYMFFVKFDFSSSLTATRTLKFGYKTWTPDVAFTGNFFDIVFGQYVRHEMEKKLPSKMRNEFIVATF